MDLGYQHCGNPLQNLARVRTQQSIMYFLSCVLGTLLSQKTIVVACHVLQLGINKVKTHWEKTLNSKSRNKILLGGGGENNPK